MPRVMFKTDDTELFASSHWSRAPPTFRRPRPALSPTLEEITTCEVQQQSGEALFSLQGIKHALLRARASGLDPPLLLCEIKRKQPAAQHKLCEEWGCLGFDSAVSCS